ncbi:hypothetical protein C1646_816738 [Rhizophagus diaphanus]|nr:hypothetical protein C1646_816738 [Rhizophagus diaphanus] [Rhizophagus sp. MUCL 43196]
MSYKFESEVLKAIEKLLKTEANYDVIIHVGKKPDNKEFHAHSGFLCCRSNYFNSIISAKDTIKKDGKYIINIPNITPQAFDFPNLPSHLLEIILKKDDLVLDEIEIWENLVKWGLAKDKILDNDVSKWNQEKFNIFERILHKLIPLIRFHDISSEDYFNKVRPYEQILSKELREDILKFHMVPGYKLTFNKYPKRCSKSNIDSSLINIEHITLFANWIERKDNYKYNNNIPYEFNLILRGSRDGFDPKSFHNKCDNKGAIITIIKIKNSNQIVGGYNPFDWSGLSINCTPDSFIFSFNDNRNVDSGIISRPIKNLNSVVISDPDWGPVFGAYTSIEVSHDLCMQRNGQWSSYPSSYTDINIPKKYFDIVDYEVFQVKKSITT